MSRPTRRSPPRGTRSEKPKPPLPERPYRDTAVLHGVLAAVICGAALLTGGDLVTAAIAAAAYFVVATAWSWWRFSRRIAASRDGETVESDADGGG